MSSGTERAGKPLVTTTHTHFLQDKRQLQTTWWNSSYTLLFILLLVVVTNNRYVYLTYLTLAGLLGIFLIAVGLYSSHREVLWNYNALLFNPLLIGYAWCLWKEKTKAAKLLAKIIAGCLALYIVYMLDKIHLQIVWPFIVLQAYWLGKGLLKKN